MSNEDRQIGLITLLASPQQAAAAIFGAFGPDTYRAGNQIFKNNENDWFKPIAVFKVASQSQSSHETETPQPILSNKEPETMSVATAIQSAAKKVKSLIGFEDAETAKFRELQRFVLQRPKIELKHRAAGEKLALVEAAKTAGAAMFNGREINFEVSRLAQEFASTSVALSKISDVESEMIGLCPSPALQRELRDLKAEQPKICGGITSLESRIFDFQRQIKEYGKILKSDLSAEERKRFERRLASDSQYLPELQAELAALVKQRDSIRPRKADLHRRMREFGLTTTAEFV